LFAFLISILFSSLLIYSFTLRFAQVHNNLLHRILYGLDGATLAAASAVCTPWRDALALPSVWRDILALLPVGRPRLHSAMVVGMALLLEALLLLKVLLELGARLVRDVLRGAAAPTRAVRYLHLHL
jgi:hypothetical protein